MLTAAEAMQTDVETVRPDMTLVDLERRFLMLGMIGFPVVEKGELVGIVSRSDVLRQLSVERSTEEERFDFYRAFEAPTRRDAAAEEAAIGARVGERAAELTVRDVMIRRVISVEPGRPLRDVARMMLDGHIHRMPVLDGGRLVGLVTTLDVVRLFSTGRLVEVEPGTASAEKLLAAGAKGASLADVRKALEERLEGLLSRATAIETDLRSAHAKDSQDRATERENDEVLERLQSSEKAHVAQVRHALARIESGDYRTCEGCGKPVGEARQAALPEATRCLACA